MVKKCIILPAVLDSHAPVKRGEESPNTAFFPLLCILPFSLLPSEKTRVVCTIADGRSRVAGNSRLGQPKRCEQKRRCRKARAPQGVVAWKHADETAKSLLLCKTVLAKAFESLEGIGNNTPR
jgi:hypothetical protein